MTNPALIHQHGHQIGPTCSRAKASLERTGKQTIIKHHTDIALWSDTGSDGIYHNLLVSIKHGVHTCSLGNGKRSKGRGPWLPAVFNQHGIGAWEPLDIGLGSECWVALYRSGTKNGGPGADALNPVATFCLLRASPSKIFLHKIISL